MNKLTNWADLCLDIYVVSLKKAEYRRSKVKAMLSDLGAKHTLFDAIDGDDATAMRDAFVCRTDRASKIYIQRERPVSNRELACSASHMQAIHHAYQAGLQRALIFEDDIDIGNVTSREISAIIKMAPANAAYIQLAITPATTAMALAEYYINTGNLFVGKKNTPSPSFVDPHFSDMSCHCTAAYIITKSGMQNIYENYFEGTRVAFPCSDYEVQSNVGLVSDRLVYRAASDPNHPGYACCVPLFATDARESLLHQDHVDHHREAKCAVELCRKLVDQRRPIS